MNPPQEPARRRVKAVVALRLLEVMRDQDVPLEVLEEEDPAVTMPRRLGLSEVVGRQIRQYREDVRKGTNLTDQEIHDLFRLVIRRPDAEEIFFKVGKALSGAEEPSRWRRIMPRGVRVAMARARVRRRLRTLFGRRVGGFARGGFSVEGRSLLFIEADPGGEACFFMTGLCEGVLESVTGRQAQMTHTKCQSRHDALCRWEGKLSDGPAKVLPTAEATVMTTETPMEEA